MAEYTRERARAIERTAHGSVREREKEGRQQMETQSRVREQPLDKSGKYRADKLEQKPKAQSKRSEIRKLSAKRTEW
jgi:hypothetical protein